MCATEDRDVVSDDELERLQWKLSPGGEASLVRLEARERLNTFVGLGGGRSCRRGGRGGGGRGVDGRKVGGTLGAVDEISRGDAEIVFNIGDDSQDRAGNDHV